MWGWCSQLQPEGTSSVHMGSDLVDFVANNVGNPLDLDNLLSYGIPFVILYAVTSTQIIRVLIEGGEQEEITIKIDAKPSGCDL